MNEPVIVCCEVEEEDGGEDEAVGGAVDIAVVVYAADDVEADRVECFLSFEDLPSFIWSDRCRKHALITHKRMSHASERQRAWEWRWVVPVEAAFEGADD